MGHIGSQSADTEHTEEKPTISEATHSVSKRCLETKTLPTLDAPFVSVAHALVRSGVNYSVPTFVIFVFLVFKSELFTAAFAEDAAERNGLKRAQAPRPGTKAFIIHASSVFTAPSREDWLVWPWSASGPLALKSGLAQVPGSADRLF